MITKILQESLHLYQMLGTLCACDFPIRTTCSSDELTWHTNRFPLKSAGALLMQPGRVRHCQAVKAAGLLALGILRCYSALRKD